MYQISIPFLPFFLGGIVIDGRHCVWKLGKEQFPAGIGGKSADEIDVTKTRKLQSFIRFIRLTLCEAENSPADRRV